MQADAGPRPGDVAIAGPKIAGGRADGERSWEGEGEGSWQGIEVLVLSPTPTHPLDAGNRRRIFHLTRTLQRMGARIVFLHYPAEADWRARVPPGALAAMQAQWDEVLTIPVTRPLHVAAADGADHGRDDWWDPAIGDMLRWVFATHRIDLCLVNYTWLSKAFEFCPPRVLKVLDTHDRFSGRRDLLARHGIAPEFFHLARAQEAAALRRADVVWSIKPQEAAFFRGLGIRRVVNMPHAEPVAAAGAARPRGAVLRFGIIGACNSINRGNIAAFLEAAVRMVEHTLLPCEIVVAGGVCALLEGAGQPWSGLPWIRLAGRVDDVAAFYCDVDVVLAPIAFSTGLKIKVGEALCHGKAVLALAHAFEGFPAQHRFHRLASLPALLAACREVVDDPTLIDDLERLSLAAVLRTREAVTRGLATTIAALGAARPALCLVAAAADIFAGSLVLDHLLEAAHYLAHLAPLCVFLDGATDPFAARTDADRAALLRVTGIGPVLLAPALLRGATGALLRAACAEEPRGMTISDLVRFPHLALWFASCPQPWDIPAVPAAGRAYVCLDTLALAAPDEGARALLGRAEATFADVVTISRRGLAPGLGRTRSAGAAAEHRVPAFWKGEQGPVLRALADQAAAREREPDGWAGGITVLADAADAPLLALTVSLILRLSAAPGPAAWPVLAAWPVRVVLPAGEIPAAPPRVAEWSGGDAARVRIVGAAGCFAPEPATLPALVVDIATHPAMECIREAFDRAPVRRVRLFSGGFAPAHGAWTVADEARGLFESVAMLQRLLGAADPGVAAPDNRDERDSRDERDDVGWASVWDEIRTVLASGVTLPGNCGANDPMESDFADDGLGGDGMTYDGLNDAGRTRESWAKDDLAA